MNFITCPCGVKLKVSPSQLKRKKYCSKNCFYKYRPKTGFQKGHQFYKGGEKGWFKNGHIPWHKNKQVKNLDDYSNELSNLHKWLRRHYGVPDRCDKCGSVKNVEWANKTEKYLRVKSDWLKLCKKCHHLYDYKKFGKRKKFYE